MVWLPPNSVPPPSHPFSRHTPCQTRYLSPRTQLGEVLPKYYPVVRRAGWRKCRYVFVYTSCHRGWNWIPQVCSVHDTAHSVGTLCRDLNTPTGHLTWSWRCMCGFSMPTRYCVGGGAAPCLPVGVPAWQTPTSNRQAVPVCCFLYVNYSLHPCKETFFDD